MGPTPKLASETGRRVLERMGQEGKYRPETGEIAYARDAQGRPLKESDDRRWVKIEYCDMGHIIDAVVWWNSNGRLTGPQSSEVRKFRRTRTTTAGTKWEKQLVEGNVDRGVQVETPRSSIESLAAMRAAGVVLDVWDIWSHIGAAVVANDPRRRVWTQLFSRATSSAPSSWRATSSRSSAPGDGAPRCGQPSR